MSLASTFRRDSPGIAAILKSGGFAGMVGSVASQIAGNVRASRPDADVVVDSYTTDRAAASVTIRDVRARTWQARDGILTRAAAGVGAEVTSR